MEETVEIEKYSLLDAIVSANEYGYNRFLPVLVSWYGPISAIEIADFVNSYSLSYEGAEGLSNTLIEYFHDYGEFTKSA